VAIVRELYSKESNQFNSVNESSGIMVE
jgi:hypothetical protein